MKRVTLATTYVSIHATAIAFIRLLCVCLFVYFVYMSLYYVLLAYSIGRPLSSICVYVCMCVNIFKHLLI